MNQSIEKTESIVLRLRDYGDHDRIIGLYTRKFGKISTFAASAKRSQKRYGTSLDLFSLVTAEVTPPSSSGKTLWRLQKTEMINPNIGLRQNLIALANVSYFADCIWNLLAEEDPHDEIFDFLINSIHQFSNPTMTFAQLLKLEMELLNLCGFGPRFFECVECNSAIVVEKVFFSFTRGGVVCQNCSHTEEGLWMPMQIFEATLQDQSKSEKDFLIIRNVLDRFVTFIIGRELKSQAFRREVTHAVL